MLLIANGRVTSENHSRVESFSDCVIAFAITLLILDIHLQDLGTNINSAGMTHAIMGLAPHFSIYVISFLIYTVAWISHHELIHDLEYGGPKAPLAEQPVPDVDCLLALPNGTPRKSSKATCGGRPLWDRPRHYMAFFLPYALVRLLLGPSHKKRNKRHEAAPGPAAFAMLCSSLLRRHGCRVVFPVPRCVLIRCYSSVLHD